MEKACKFAGFDACVTQEPQKIRDASHVILPGVGAVRDAVTCLKERELWDLVKEQAASGKPFLGICLGMQLLFSESLENGVYTCLGLVPGRVVPFQDRGLRIPHMGWNSLDVKENPLIPITNTPPDVYFVHSYHAWEVPEEYVIAKSSYDYPFPAAVQRENVFGTQFHPEKSGDTGIRMIKNFGGLKA